MQARTSFAFRVRPGLGDVPMTPWWTRPGTLYVRHRTEWGGTGRAGGTALPGEGGLLQRLLEGDFGRQAVHDQRDDHLALVAHRGGERGTVGLVVLVHHPHRVRFL